MGYSKYTGMSCIVGILAFVVHHQVEDIIVSSNDVEEIVTIEYAFDDSFEKIALSEIKTEAHLVWGADRIKKYDELMKPKVELADSLGEMIKHAYVLTAMEGLNVRSGAGTDFEILGFLNDESKIEVYGEVDGWYQIKYDEYVGYVSKKYVTDELPSKEVAVTTQPIIEADSKQAESTTGFYQNIKSIQNPNALMVLVNKNYALSSSYKPSDLRILNVTSVNGTIYLRSEAASQAEALFAAAANEEGLTLLGRSGYRSYQTQSDLYSSYVKNNGQAAADTFSARPGHSEHQTGLALDITASSVNSELTTSFGYTTEGQWVKENAHRFGFIISYPAGRESETGYQYEPWHIRYVGVDTATQIYQNNWILDQYVISAGLISTN
ncbi:MAG TPA: hypothetical protein DCY20_05265 [Firmicutes bacterium]|nr:hypothetical protein [Bacillota bacterium]